METKPLVSIICVTYNAIEHIEDFLKYIAPYKTPQVELVIMDGNSTDGTKDIIQTHKDKGTVDLFISEPDSGIYDAMNKAVKYCQGKWLYFIGADDRVLPDFNKMLLELKEEDTIYYGNVLFRGKKQMGKFTSYKLAKRTIDHQCMFYPKQVFDIYQYNLLYKIGADYVVNMQLWNNKRFKFEYRNLIICHYNDTGVSSLTDDKPLRRDKDKIIKELFSPGVYWLRKLRRAVLFFKKDKLG